MNDEGKLLTMIRYAGSDAGRVAYDSMLVELARLRAIEASVDRMTSAKDLDPTGVCHWCGEECSTTFCRPECYRSYRGAEIRPSDAPPGRFEPLEALRRIAAWCAKRGTSHESCDEALDTIYAIACTSRSIAKQTS